MRLGLIGYVNNLPVDLAIKKGLVHLPADLEIIEGPPREIGRGLAEGRLDAACVPSIGYLAHLDEWVLLPEAAIASRGPVDSVLLYSKRPFEELKGRRVAVTQESSTGAAMLRVLLEGFRKVYPDYVRAPSDLAAMLAGHDAGLVIGDAALRSLRGSVPGALFKMDLGHAWQQFTGVPMVYAVWAVRREVRDRDPEAVRAVSVLLRQARRWGEANRARIVEEAAKRTGLDASRLEGYYRNLHYGFEQSERGGLLRFAQEAERLGILDAGSAPRLEVALA